MDIFINLAFRQACQVRHARGGRSVQLVDGGKGYQQTPGMTLGVLGNPVFIALYVNGGVPRFWWLSVGQARGYRSLEEPESYHRQGHDSQCSHDQFVNEDFFTGRLAAEQP